MNNDEQIKVKYRNIEIIDRVVVFESLVLSARLLLLIVGLLTRMGYTRLSQIRFVRQPMRVGGLWECEVAV